MNYRFEQLINLEQLRKLLNSHNGFSNMPYGLFDTNENNLIAVGWQDICMQFHRVDPVSCARCRESDAYLKEHLSGVKGEYLEYCCKNGMVEVAMPVMVEGRHLATFITGQFFYEEELPDRAFFSAQADELGFDRDAYLAALEGVPLFSREHVRSNMLFLQNMVELLAETGFANLKLEREVEVRKKAEEVLLKREAELQQHTDFQNNLLLGLQNADVIFCLAEGGRITYCNDKRFGEPFGLTEADMAADPEFINLVHPDDRLRIAEIYRRRSAGEPMPTNFEVGVQWVNGERREIEVVVSVIGYDPLKTLIIYKDITERKRMEEVLVMREQEFRAVAENSPDTIVRYDLGCRRIYGNPAFQRMVCKPSEYLLGTTPVDNSPILDPVKYQNALRRALESGEEVECEYSWAGVDGRMITSHSRMVPERGVDGKIVSVLAIARDITERKRMEEELQAKNSELERFTYTVSHDLKSPVITIKSFSGSIKNDLAINRYDRAGKDLDRICAAADKMAALLDDLLKLSRSGKTIDAPEPVDMTALVGSALANLAGVLEEGRVQVVVQPDLPVVSCDRQRMLEVLQNLIENAVKYRGDQPEPRIEIGLRHDNGRQVFFVQDNGTGIDPKYHDNIFGLFNRLETKIQGTGVGLALVKRIIEKHGGSIWVESDGCGNGSTFCFTVG